MDINITRECGIFSAINEVLYKMSVSNENNFSIKIKNRFYNNEEIWSYFFQNNITFKNKLSYEKEIFPPSHQIIEKKFETYKEYYSYINKNIINEIEIKKNIIDRIESEYNNFKNKKTIGIHVRCSDIDATYKTYRGNKNLIFAKIEDYNNIIKKNIDYYDKVFICSDNQNNYENIKKTYGDKIFKTSTTLMEDSDEKLFSYVNTKNINKYIEDVFVDAYLLSKCNFIVFNGISNLSRFSLLLNPNIDCKNICLKESEND